MRRRRPAALAAVIPAALAATLLTAPAAHAGDADIVINEVQSNSAVGAPDFFELTNVGAAPVDISGWIARDDKDDEEHIVFPAGTVIAPGDFAVFEPEPLAGFGLGKADSVRIFTAAGALVARYGWTEHAFSEGRLPDGTGAFVDTEPTPGAPNVAREVVEAVPVDSPVVVNEVQSADAAGGPDWVELVNRDFERSVDVSGWILRDDDDLSLVRIPAGTVLAPGGYLVVETADDVVASSFSLGKADAVRLYTADGTGLVDQYSWTEHASTEGRLPDGSGTWVDTEPTPGAPNVARFVPSPIVINEIESNGDPRGDWVELANTDTVETVDLSGWSLVDGDPSHEPIVLPEGTTIESGGYRAIITDAAGAYSSDFGLGGADSVTLRDAAGQIVDSFTWEAHAPATYARCADMTGDFAPSATATFEVRNDCASVEEPAVEAEPWPFGGDVRLAVAPGTWGDDMSGLDLAADGTLFAVNNDNAEIFELEAAESVSAIARSWVAHYPDGSGQPDAEGISVAGDGAIFLATERDNRTKGVSRPSILRVELGADGESTTTHEWDLTSLLGPLGANLGPEAIEWISDADAVRLGVRDLSSIIGPGDEGAVAAAEAGGAYDPTAYGDHFGGLFAIAIEQTGLVHLVVLEADRGVTLLQATAPGDALDIVMGLDWRAGGNALWAVCDEACDNRHAELAFVDGLLTTQRAVHAPAAMDPGYTNEGLAIDWCALDPAATPTVLWISDSPHEGVSLRSAAGDACVAPPAETPAPAPTPTPTEAPGAAVGVGQGGTGASAGALPRTGGEAPVGAVMLGGLLLLAGIGLALRHRRAA
ncbi:lamin tail domain-containing protein [Agrococcus sp. Marseille-Q4369]|uniref:lamin tail domain-containing protein n=1 Tax=Agrococcus sp. Marseille-Q4369 TaxID=2810513 RepID=UPI001B8D0321|nr:lamin tail domain-containing protein [Agrococcus sp. Marseille-Q4369]QUW19950.1 lamin tail domain-containing protein [Agrococcus sp. Marseille-Q4369]